MVRLSRTQAEEGHTAEAYPGFRSMKQMKVLLLGVLHVLLLPGCDASPLHGYSQQYVTCTHFIRLGGERHIDHPCTLF